jgi:Ca2+-binding EF-hand superfamily protein
LAVRPSQGFGGSFQPPSFASLDSNNDAQITLDEFKAGAPGGADAKKESRLDALFKAMDTDGSGGVSSDEKSAFDQKLQARRQDHHAGLAFLAQQIAAPGNSDVFAATDTNGDGSVSLDELSNDPAAAAESPDSLQKLFGMIDSNSDGSISETESSDFLDAVKSAIADRTSSAPPASASPPPPPPEATADAGSTSSLDLLGLAQSAYSSTSNSASLVDMLASLLKTAA